MKRITPANAEDGAQKTFSKMQDIKDTLRKLKPFIGKKADKLWVRHSTGDRMEKQEWEQVYLSSSPTLSHLKINL